jgi:hypothetical protein
VSECSSALPLLAHKVTDVSGELWFLFLMFGLKIPAFGIGYLFYRVNRAQEEEWEHQAWNGPLPGDDDSGGGGSRGPGPRPSPRPRGGLVNVREPKRRPPRSATTRTLARNGRPTSRRRLPAREQANRGARLGERDLNAEPRARPACRFDFERPLNGCDPFANADEPEPAAG